MVNMAVDCMMPRPSYSTGDSVQTTGDDIPTSDPVQTQEQAHDTDTALPQLTSRRPASPYAPLRVSESSTRAGNLRHRAPYSFQVQDPRNPAHRRTGSTLKTVMRKIFTRKRRSQSEESDDNVNISQAPSYTGDGSLLGLQNSVGPKQSRPPLQKDTFRPTTLQAVPGGLETISRRRRRATLPSLVFSDGDPREAIEAAVHSEKGTRERKTYDPSVSHSQEDLRTPTAVRLNRRSRSANALRALSNDHRMSPIQWKQPNAEVNGTASDSELSRRPLTASTVESASKASTAPSVVEEQESIAPNIGNLVNSMHHDENATLEQRLTTLEVKLIDLEFAIARMQTRGGSTTPGDKPRSKKSPTSDIGRHKHVRKHSSSYFPPVESSNGYHTTDEDRPLSMTTIRPSTLHRSHTLQAPSSTSLADYNGISIEQYSALVMLLRREQSARRNLESQVSGLRDDIQQLQRVARDSMPIGTMYPIQSEQDILRFRRRDRSTSTSPSAKKVGSPYDSDSDWDRSDVYYAREHFLDRSKPRIEIAPMI